MGGIRDICNNINNEYIYPEKKREIETMRNTVIKKENEKHGQKLFPSGPRSTVLCQHLSKENYLKFNFLQVFITCKRV